MAETGVKNLSHTYAGVSGKCTIRRVIEEQNCCYKFLTGTQTGLLSISGNPFNYPSLLSFDTTPQCFTMNAGHLPFAALHFFCPLFPISHQRFQRTLLSSHSVSSHLPSRYQHPSSLATYTLPFFLNPSHTH